MTKRRRSGSSRDDGAGSDVRCRTVDLRHAPPLRFHAGDAVCPPLRSDRSPRWQRLDGGDYREEVRVTPAAAHTQPTDGTVTSRSFRSCVSASSTSAAETPPSSSSVSPECRDRIGSAKVLLSQLAHYQALYHGYRGDGDAPAYEPQNVSRSVSHDIRNEPLERRSRSWSTSTRSRRSSNVTRASSASLSRSRSRRSLSSSSSSSSSAERKEEERKHYPQFTAEYARRYARESRPFMRVADDEDSPHPRGASLVLYDEYRLLSVLGKGTYSKVVLVESLKTYERCALKVFRNERNYVKACWDEVHVLNELSRAAPNCEPSHEYQSRVARFNAHIAHIPHPVHQAIVFPPLGPSLLNTLERIKSGIRAHLADLMGPRPIGRRAPHPKASHSPARRGSTARAVAPRWDGLRQDASGADGDDDDHDAGSDDEVEKQATRGMPLHVVRSVLFQILTLCANAHRRGIIHTDLKPENVLFESTESLPMTLRCPLSPSFTTRMATVTSSSHPPECRAGGPRSRSSSPPSRLVTVFSPTVPSEATATGASTRHFGPAYTNACMSPALSAVAAPPALGENAARRVDEPDGGEARAGGSHHLPGLPGATSRGDAHELIVTTFLPVHNGVRVIDCGAAQFAAQFVHRSPVDRVTPVSYDPIQTSHYRAPEVLLGVGWTFSSDMWSVGCMVPELVTGECMFMPNSTLEHLALFQHVIGPFTTPPPGPAASHRPHPGGWGGGDPDHAHDVLRDIFARGRHFKQYFATSGSHIQLLWPTAMTTTKDEEYVFLQPTVAQRLQHCPLLLDLCMRMLSYNPFTRITAEEALQHPFFLEGS